MALRRPYSKVIVTAPSFRQCKDVWLSQAQKHIEENPGCDPRVKLFFQFTGTGIGIMGKRNAVWGVQLVTASTKESMAGLHDENMHLICDESCGISREIQETLQGTLTNPNGFWIQIANPTLRDSFFFDLFHSPTYMRKWRRFTWNAEDTPDSKWFSQERNREIAAEYGITSDVYRYRVLGEFPSTDPRAIISDTEVFACMREELKIPCQTASSARQFGIDFSRMGGDESVIYQRSGNAVIGVYQQPRVEPNDVCRYAHGMQQKVGWRDDQCKYIIDADGMGQGMIAYLGRDLNKSVVPLNNGGRANNAKKYGNRVTELWFELAARMRNREIYLPHDPTIAKQLSTRVYDINAKGQILLERKEIMFKKGIPSPDRADALSYAFLDRAKGRVAV